jgi:hypothetical protein
MNAFDVVPERARAVSAVVVDDFELSATSDGGLLVSTTEYGAQTVRLERAALRALGFTMREPAIEVLSWRDFEFRRSADSLDILSLDRRAVETWLSSETLAALGIHREETEQ